MLERVIPDPAIREGVVRLVGHLQDDGVALVTLKGHLVLEEKMTACIEDFVFHTEELEDARLTFVQKMAICRSMCLDNQGNSIWALIAKINKLRNTLSHSLDGDKRTKAISTAMIHPR